MKFHGKVFDVEIAHTKRFDVTLEKKFVKIRTFVKFLAATTSIEFHMKVKTLLN